MFSIFYSTTSFLSSALVLSLLPWFIRFRSIPGLSAIVWLFVVNLLYGLNAIAFTGDTLHKIPVYCDVVTKLLIGMQMVVPTAMLCYTFSIHDWLVRPKERNLKEKLFEYRSYFHATLCFLMPVVYMALHIIVQDHRFDIIQDVGCLPSSSNTALSWALIWLTLVVPFCVFAIYGFFAFKYAWAHHSRYYADYMTIWELIDSELLFTKAPFGIVRIIRLSAMIAVVMLCTLCVPYYTLAVLIRTDGFTFSRKPNLSRIDVFESLNDTSPSVTTMRLFLWSGPLYSVLLFATSIDKAVLCSYPFVFKKYILRRPIGLRPDPSPGIDLSTLTPVPVRKRVHRRVIRKSRQYDPPLSVMDYDIPLPPRPDPGYRANAILPPVPALAAVSQQEPRRPDPARISSSKPRVQPRGLPSRGIGNTAFQEAMRQHVEARIKFPMHTIPESPSSHNSHVSTQNDHSTPEAEVRITVPDRIKPEHPIL